MGNHNNRNAFVIQFLEKIHYLFAGGAVQSAGRFIGKKNFRMVDDSTGNGNTLLLSAGKLCGTEMETIAEAYPFQGFCGQRNTLLFGNAGVDQRQINIFKGGLLWQQVKALENSLSE